MCDQCDYAEAILVGRVLAAEVEEEGLVLYYSDGRKVLIWEQDGALIVKESDLPTC